MAGYDTLANVYDVLADDVDVKSWISYVKHFFPQDANSLKIADVGCGTGRYSIALAKEGYQVAAVDVSRQMLHLAAENARAAGVQIRFANQSATGLALPQQDVVLCICDVVNHLSVKETALFFEKAYQVLSPNGLLMFDISSAAKLQRLAKEEFFFEDREEVTYFWQNELNKEKNAVDMELTFFKKNGQNYKREDTELTQYIHEVPSMLALLEQAGFVPRAYAFLTEEEPGTQTTRIQFVAQKIDHK